MLDIASIKSGPKDQVALHYYYMLRLRIGARLTRYRNCKFHNGCQPAALSAGTLMASAGTPYRPVPAHFYPWALQIAMRLKK